MADNVFRERAITMMREAGKKRDQPIMLATGEETWVYLDGKGFLTTRWKLNLAADAMLQHVLPLKPTAIGGPTMGADMLSHVMVSRAWQDEQLAWFSVRDKRKTTHGLGLQIEGHRLGPNDKVIVTDDVANSGKSLIEACLHVWDTGATILAVAPFVDRSGLAGEKIESVLGIPFLPLMTYEDLGIEPLAA